MKYLPASHCFCLTNLFILTIYPTYHNGTETTWLAASHMGRYPTPQLHNLITATQIFGYKSFDMSRRDGGVNNENISPKSWEKALNAWQYWLMSMLLTQHQNTCAYHMLTQMLFAWYRCVLSQFLLKHESVSLKGSVKFKGMYYYYWINESIYLKRFYLKRFRFRYVNKNKKKWIPYYLQTKCKSKMEINGMFWNMWFLGAEYKTNKRKTDALHYYMQNVTVMWILRWRSEKWAIICDPKIPISKSNFTF